ncbi:hypothetical protein L3Q72_06625 [Vibrio sp. JC009]|uniref:hypothetical protein n=1 Tax=Vibrio sp. JC009 TaxID=2912314 RepID=UPI0023B0A537|nr:hypothetical protein [Vibrio sp. JC009]WED23062.1 hypothetical protein L3Q72_06625 [Vibrio sp. JC009]
MNLTLVHWLDSALQRWQEWKGRLIAYLGGGGLSAFSANVTAQAKQAAEVTTTVAPDMFTANLFTALGLIFVGGRLIFDIVVYIDQRRLKRSKQNGCKTTDSPGS